MGTRLWATEGNRRVAVSRVIAILLTTLAVFGSLGADESAIASKVYSSPSPVMAHAWGENGSGGSDPSSSPAGNTLCPSGGPTILGVEWNCVAILDLTELLLILASIGIIAYVFRDSDRAELPGEAEIVPVTAEEESEYRRARKLGIPYDPGNVRGGDDDP